MALHPVSIPVMRGGQMVDRVDRPPRRAPDGRLAIEYLGLVYPLTEAGCIDLESVWFYPSQAPICLDPPEDFGVSGSRGWQLDLDGYRPYIFLNGPEEVATLTVRRLQSAGFTSERWGPSFREGGGGASFDWFIRLPRQEDQRAPSKWELEQIFREIDVRRKEAVGERDATFRGDNDEQVLALRRQLVEVEAQLAEQVHGRDRAEATARELRRTFQREIARARDRASFLSAALVRFETSVTPSVDGQAIASPELDSLSKALEAARGELEETLSQWLLSEQERQKSAVEIAELRARVAELESAARPGSADRNSGRARAWLRELDTTLSVFTPSVHLVRDSAEYITTELADRTDLYTKLRSLEVDRTSLKAKRVQAADGWLELHFSTGQSRDGRLYFRKSDGDGARWAVLVSDKAAQPRDFDWIAQQ